MSRQTYIALLRGINVGGKNRVAMEDLRQCCADEGCAGVRTYIQSGNVIFDASAAVAGKIAVVIRKRFGVPVVLRSVEELKLAVEGNPFLHAGVSEDSVHLMFLADVPASDRIEALDPARSPGDSFKVRGRDVYLHMPNGMGNTKLTNAYFDSKLGTVSTARNWRTCLKLLQMATSGS